jgi:hypothetical protein
MKTPRAESSNSGREGSILFVPAPPQGPSLDTVANPGAKDNLNFNGNVGIGPYSVVILSQD